MKKLSKIVVIGILATMLLGVVAYAASPADIYSELAGVTAEEAIQQRQEGKTYGELAQEADVYEEFIQKMQEEKIALIEQRVEEGLMTREDADAFIAALKENMGNCDPSNPQRLGRQYHLRQGNGKGYGNGACGGNRGNGSGRGQRGLGLGRK